MQRTRAMDQRPDTPDAISAAPRKKAAIARPVQMDGHATWPLYTLPRELPLFSTPSFVSDAIIGEHPNHNNQ